MPIQVEIDLCNIKYFFSLYRLSTIEVFHGLPLVLAMCVITTLKLQTSKNYVLI